MKPGKNLFGFFFLFRCPLIQVITHTARKPLCLSRELYPRWKFSTLDASPDSPPAYPERIG